MQKIIFPIRIVLAATLEGCIIIVNIMFKNNSKSIASAPHLAFGLLEVMISAMILSISLLGVASMQSRVINITVESDRKETAYRMARQLINFTNNTNQQTLLNFINPNNPSTKKDCLYVDNNSGCTEDEYYLYTINSWKQSVHNTLPSGQSCICVVANNNNKIPPSIVLRFAVRWKTLSGTYSNVYLDHTVISKVTAVSNYCPTATDVAVCSNYTPL